MLTKKEREEIVERYIRQVDLAMRYVVSVMRLNE